ncbi:MAG: GyrI-like domain-containing protein [Eubacteriaceae bacterium]
MKHEWRKYEKNIYLPNKNPVFLEVPSYNYFTIKGKGNPNDEFFSQYIGVLYSLSYAVRMSYKDINPPNGYYEYTVYPLEGIWDIDNKEDYVEGQINKDNLIFELMIRQPDFVDKSFAKEIIEKVKLKKPHALLDKIEYKEIEDGQCVQILHKGSYDNERDSFIKMDDYCIENALERLSMIHREIYLNDARKTEPEKLKTVLRYKVKEIKKLL